MSFINSIEWTEIALTVGKIILGAICIPLIIVIVLILLGFTAGGVALGSVAAGWMSSIGIVAAGSIFAILQSLGSMGFALLFSPPALLLEIVIALGLTVYYLSQKYLIGNGSDIPGYHGGDDNGDGDVGKVSYLRDMGAVNEVISVLSPLINIFLSTCVNGLAGMISGLGMAAICVYFRGRFTKTDVGSDECVVLLCSGNELKSFPRSDHKKIYAEAVLLPLAGLIAGIYIGVFYPYKFL